MHNQSLTDKLSCIDNYIKKNVSKKEKKEWTICVFPTGRLLLMVKWHKKAYHHGKEKDLEVARNKDGKQNVFMPANVIVESTKLMRITH